MKKRTQALPNSPGRRGQIAQARTAPLQYRGPDEAGLHRFAGDYLLTHPGSHGYTLRVLPCHPDLRDPLEMGLVHWAG